MKITKIIAREIFDSRGNPTVECELTLENGRTVTASVPSGMSKSKYEARELRDGGPRLDGLGVLKAVENIETKIAPMLVGQEPKAIEMDSMMIELDGTIEKTNLGANAMLAVSMAVYRANALIENLELYAFIAHILGFDSVSMPFPWINVINGGMHAKNNLSIQEFLIIPIGTQTFRSAFETAVNVFHELNRILIKHNRFTCVGDEGGYAGNFRAPEEALDFIMQAIENASDYSTTSCILALDVAASHIYDKKNKLYKFGDKYLETTEVIELYQKLVNNYPIYAIEDGLDQDDFEGWERLVKLFEQKIQIVGDDLTATNLERIYTAIEKKAITGAIIKPNQIGTVTEALQALKLCQENGINTIVSHRSGETDDTFIADLAVGANSGQIKAGSCSRGERLAKYNRLLAIEDALTFNLIN